ncbi:sulfite exporter TauE/SafE family protein [Effusibacillus dendaii]|uniref:Probable membrane transporter protein n=1 Tax=Effusibacillus dendaii TaxID=2743772 RepID=A0A7I8DHJ0_9BACL|nr:sulfite exporter TauE/SafE family protein [Effusibacillus dendaii]BCJ87291.1 UPF0721 transmembrane protein YjnA [Effusibacillus dendaii]
MGLEFPLTGFVVGLLVGFTGMGGALLMTPILVFLFGISPTLAIGTDLVYASITKLFGALQHWRQRTIDFYAVKWLSMGSLPGALLGSGAVLLMRQQIDTHQLNSVVGKILGVTYLLIVAVMVWRIYRGRSRREQISAVSQPSRQKLIVLGLLGGCIVGMTSVGSGTLFMAFLTLIYPIASAKLVGTDIVQAVLVTGAAGLAHLSAGNVDMGLVAQLLVGSIPGILIGSRLTVRIPDAAVRTLLMVMLLWSGMKLLI